MSGIQPTSAPSVPVRLLSVDVDDLLVANADFFEEPMDPTYQSAIESELQISLRILQESGVRGTFFVNTQYCDTYPTLLHDIVAHGHTLASHGFRHRNIAKLTIEEFEADLCRSLELLTKVQTNVVGYRPPAFSMPYDRPHLEVLRRNGIRYVSSGVGVARSNAPRSAEPVEVAPGLLHVPISTIHLLGGRIKYAIGYGVAARLMPEAVYRITLRRWLRNASYFHWYCHSFELGGLPDRFQIPYRGLGARISTAVYATRCRRRQAYLQSILSAVPFVPIEEALSAFQASSPSAATPRHV